MAFDNPSNRGRALKIVEILAHVEKSATANKAERDEIREILTPASQMLNKLCGYDEPGEIPQREAAVAEPADPARRYGMILADGPEFLAQPAPPLSAGQRAAMILADQASLPVLIASLCGRLDAHAGKLNQEATQ